MDYFVYQGHYVVKHSFDINNLIESKSLTLMLNDTGKYDEPFNYIVQESKYEEKYIFYIYENLFSSFCRVTFNKKTIKEYYKTGVKISNIDVVKLGEKKSNSIKTNSYNFSNDPISVLESKINGRNFYTIQEKNLMKAILKKKMKKFLKSYEVYFDNKEKIIKDKFGRVVLHNKNNESSIHIYTNNELEEFIKFQNILLDKEIILDLKHNIFLYYKNNLLAQLKLKYHMNKGTKFKIIQKFPYYNIIYSENEFVRNITRNKKEKNVKSKIKESKVQVKSNKFALDRNYTRNIFDLYKQDRTITQLQLLKTTNNHLAKHHHVKDVVVKIPYISNVNKLYNSFNASLHYCEDCDIYFDFYESFEEQLNLINIKISDLVLTVHDENNKVLELNKALLNKESMLKKLGYNVISSNNLSKIQRQQILLKAHENNILSYSEIKNLLSYFIRFQGKRKGMEIAVNKWKEDLTFINEQIKKSK